MRRKMWTLPLCTVLAAGLAGCSANENQVGEKNEKDAFEAGYHTTEKDSLVRRISYNAPMPRVFSDTNQNNPESKKGTENLVQDNDYSRSDQNYHKHEDQSVKAKSVYYTSYDGKLVETIRQKANQVQNVKDSRAVVTSNGILVALDLDDDSQAKQAKATVRDRVKTLTGKRKLHIVTNTNNYYSSMNLDNRLRSGIPVDMSKLKIDDLYRIDRTP